MSRTRVCPYPGCGAEFVSSTAYGIHTEHHRSAGERLRRGVSCWSCAADIPYGVARCEACGSVNRWAADALEEGK